MHVNFLPAVVQQFAFNDPDITDDSITEKKKKKNIKKGRNKQGEP